MKKIMLSLGTLSTIIVPTFTTISCKGEVKTENLNIVKDEKILNYEIKWENDQRIKVANVGFEPQWEQETINKLNDYSKLLSTNPQAISFEKKKEIGEFTNLIELKQYKSLLLMGSKIIKEFYSKEKDKATLAFDKLAKEGELILTDIKEWMSKKVVTQEDKDLAEALFLTTDELFMGKYVSKEIHLDLNGWITGLNSNIANLIIELSNKIS